MTIRSGAPPRDDLLQKMMDMILSECHWSYTTLREMSVILEEAFVENNPKKRFLLFRNFRVPLTELDKLPGRRSYRVSQHGDILIIRFMPGTAHELGSQTFQTLMMRKVGEMGISEEDLKRFGSARVHAHGGERSSKEPDQSFTPATRRDKVPSVVLEVGVSESLEELQCDARWWLTKTGGRTKIVFLVHITVGDHPEPETIQRIHLEVWWNRPDSPGGPAAGPGPGSSRPTRQQQRHAPYVPAPVQALNQGRRTRDQRAEMRVQAHMNTVIAASRAVKFFEIDLTPVDLTQQPVKCQASHGDSLEIPWDHVFDDYPLQSAPQNLEFTREDFIRYGNLVWYTRYY